MIEIGNKEITTIEIGRYPVIEIDIGSTKVWPDSSSGPTPGPVYALYIDSYTPSNIGYLGATLTIYVRSTKDGAAKDLSYSVQENGVTVTWIHLLQRQAVSNMPYDYVYYFGVNTNSGGVRHAGITFTQNESNLTAQLSVTQYAYTAAFENMSIKTNVMTDSYGLWVIGTATNGTGGPGNGYPRRGAVIACDRPITSTKIIKYKLTASRLKNLADETQGYSNITLTLTQVITPGSSVKVDSSSTGKTYYGAYVVLTDTSWSNTAWASTPGTNTTMSPYPAQNISSVSIIEVLST